MSHKDAAALIGSIGPSDQHRSEIRQSWFGSLMGQSTVAVLMIIAYLAAIGLLFHYVGDALTQFQQTNPLLFWAAIGTPLVLVACFSVVPAILRARRESKLYPLAASDTPPAPGYFRLHPYDAADKDNYTRPDGALAQALAWVTHTTQPVLYLSGVSGSGKSSLVQAGLTPALEAQGWGVLHLRGMGAPLTVLNDALLAPELHAAPPAPNATARTLLESAGQNRETGDGTPLLIVLDQFEEFLILDGGAEKSDYAALLRDLVAAPVPGVTLLHVYRSDYRELIFREGLPDPVERDTAFSLLALTRRDAENFLKGGPVQLQTRGYDALFAGLDRIEQARGLYRPITLNMVGFVLQRQGSTLAAEPDRLIEAYLRDCITTGEAKDFAKPVLDTLVTEAGTKASQSAARIADVTGLAVWQVRATLSDLRRHGLVRPLDGVWEISHDFLARVIGQITGRLRRPWQARVGSPTLAIVAVGWLAAIGVGVPSWVQWKENEALDAIRELGFSQMRDVDGGFAFSLSTKDLGQEEFEKFGELAQGLASITALELNFATEIRDLSPIAGLKTLKALDLSAATRISDLTPITDMTQLKTLNLSDADRITSLDPISGLTNLASLDLSYASSISSLAPLSGARGLTTLNISYLRGVTDLTPIAKHKNLKALYMTFATGISDLGPLAGHEKLEILDLSGADGISSLSPLDTLPHLRELHFGGEYPALPEKLESLVDINCRFLEDVRHDLPETLLATCDE